MQECVAPNSSALLTCAWPRAAIDTQQVCTSVGGVWRSAACKLGTQPLCASVGGTWAPRKMWSLEGGVDLLLVGLLQGCGGYPFFDPCARQGLKHAVKVSKRT